jgi:hypothetical protein
MAMIAVVSRTANIAVALGALALTAALMLGV